MAEPAKSTLQFRRFIDGKFSTDIKGNIVKRSNGEIIPDDEPLFLIRARDTLALGALIMYTQLSLAAGCNDYHFEKLEGEIKRFQQFRKDYPERMKLPSITRGK